MFEDEKKAETQIYTPTKNEEVHDISFDQYSQPAKFKSI